jgi:transcriptional regulator with XRE-family HTH domain
MAVPRVGSIEHSLVLRRRDLGLTLRQLAARTGISYLKLHHFEHGLRPRADEVRRIAEALGCTVAQMEARHDQ